MDHVVSWSGGKDSTATVILCKNHLSDITSPGDRVIILFSEVMFDKKKGISGINPTMMDFIHYAAGKFRSWGFEVNILHAEKDYLDVFYHRMEGCRKCPEHEGRLYGFPEAKRCAVRRDCKMAPLEKFKKGLDGKYIEYVGLAKDEPERLSRLYANHTNAVSLLDRYGLTEADAMGLCRERGLLSPFYELKDEDGKTQFRDGCWMCMHARTCEHSAVKKENPEAWNRFVALENEPDLVYPLWNNKTKETLHERDLKISGRVL